MGSFSLVHWLIVILVIMLLFGRGKISELMGDMAKGINSFKKGLADDEAPHVPAGYVQPPAPVYPSQPGYAPQAQPVYPPQAQPVYPPSQLAPPAPQPVAPVRDDMPAELGPARRCSASIPPSSC